MSRPRALTDDDRALIRLVAGGRSNTEIAGELGIPAYTLRSRVKALHGLLGTGVGPGGNSAISRVRMTRWAYENGLMNGVARTVEPGDVPVELAAELLDLCQAIVADRPRGDLRVLARRALRIAGSDK